MTDQTNPGELRTGLFAYVTLPDGGGYVRAVEDTRTARDELAEYAEVRGASVELRVATLRRGFRRQVEQWSEPKG